MNFCKKMMGKNMNTMIEKANKRKTDKRQNVQATKVDIKSTRL